MARDWVKLHVGILDDPRFGALTPEAGWTWTRMLAIAGRNEDGGRLGSVENIAWIMHTTPETVTATVAQLNGWIVERDGELWLRDWSEWQPASTKERKAAFMARRNEKNEKNETERAERNGTERTYARARVTRPEETRTEENRRDQNKTKNSDGAADAAPAWTDFYEAVSDSLGGIEVMKANGAPSAGVGRLAAIAGRCTDSDVPAAIALWRRYAASEEWEFRKRGLADLHQTFAPWAYKHGRTAMVAAR